MDQILALIQAHPHLILGGALGSVGIWIAWKLIMRYVPDAIVNSIMVRVEMALQGKGPDGQPIADPDDRLLVVKIFTALVEWGEKKLPDDGLGQQKLAMVLNKIYTISALVPLIGTKLSAGLRANEPKLIEFINALVIKMNKRMEKDVPPPLPPAPAP